MSDRTRLLDTRDKQPNQSLSQQYFDDVYRVSRDPWHFETSAYEAQKYADSLAILPRKHYRNALELGCSIGVFTQMLGPRCSQLLAVDIAAQAVAEAKERCTDQPAVRFERRSLPSQFPDGIFDLITVCEVAYYWSAEDLQTACRCIAQHQSEGADLLLVHWTPEVHDYPLPGDVVHDLWLEQPWWQTVAARPQATYRMDVLRRNALAVL